MLPLRNFLASFTSSSAHNMVKKAPPPPTVSAAIKSAEDAKPTDGGKSFTALDCIPELMNLVEHAIFAAGCFVRQPV